MLVFVSEVTQLSWDFESVGRGFESLRACHLFDGCSLRRRHLNQLRDFLIP